MGMVPKFENIDEQEAYEMLTTAGEVIRMVRDGDSNSEDERARSIYGKLFTDY